MTPSLKTTPTGTQSAEVLTLRRVIVGLLNSALFIVLTWWGADILGAGGWTWVDIALLIALLAILPWTVLGFWNAVIGLYMLHGARDPLGQTAPFAKDIDPDAPITLKTAIFMTLRNEDPARALHRIKLIRQALEDAGQGAHFAYFLLSDTNKADVAAEEEAGFAAWKGEVGDAPVFYRRRTDNTGFKAGNVADFVNRWGDDYDLMLPLDADSLMDAPTILTGVRQMQAHPKIGILQTLVVGMPSNSAFARIFQFGMRQGMRSYINGQAWWTGECGQFWGHNAFVRITPFREACELPVLPGEPPFGGHILSHDQVEATFMRRAGYEVRIVPRECGSWEENPPTLLEFMRRNTRWCQGNLQYFKLLDQPGLFPVSRFQLIWAILMFVSVPGWTFLLMLAAMKPFDSEGMAGFPAASALALYLVFLVMNQAPKLAGIVDVLLTSGGARRYGGALRFLFAAMVEMVHSWVLGAVDSFRTTVFILGLLFGKSVTWGGQARDAHGVEWRVAASNLWPQTLFGAGVVGAMASQSTAFALWSLPITLGYLIAIPFCVISAAPEAGALLKRHGLFGVPEEFDTPEIVRKAQAN